MKHRIARTLIASILVAGPVVAQQAPRRGGYRMPSPTPSPTQQAEETPKSAEQQPAAAASVAATALVQLTGWKVEAAAATLETHREQLGATPEYTASLGLLRAEQGRRDEGITLLTQAAAASPADPAPDYFRGEVLSWQKKQQDAQKAWQAAADRARAAAEADPENARAHYFRGAALVRLGKHAEARAALQKAKEKGFSPLLVGFQMGLSHFGQSQWDALRQQLDAVIAADPGFAYAYFYRGLAWNKLDRKDNMINDLDQFVKLAPNAPDADTARALLGAYSR